MNFFKNISHKVKATSFVCEFIAWRNVTRAVKASREVRNEHTEKMSRKTKSV